MQDGDPDPSILPYQPGVPAVSSTSSATPSGAANFAGEGVLRTSLFKSLRMLRILGTTLWAKSSRRVASQRYSHYGVQYENNH